MRGSHLTDSQAHIARPRGALHSKCTQLWHSSGRHRRQRGVCFPQGRIRRVAWHDMGQGNVGTDATE